MGEIVKTEHPDFFALTPQQKIEKASEMAKVLQDVVKQAHLSRNLGGKKDHLEYEAWQTIGQFFGATPVTEWSHPIMDDGKIIGYEARVQVFNGEGRIIGAAENMCMRDEKNWKDKSIYALRSMAQTRAASKALRSVFAFVAVLAGYEATPLEEMEGVERKGDKKKDPNTLREPRENGVTTEIKDPDAPATDAQVGAINAILKKLGIADDYTAMNKISKIIGKDGEPITMITALTKDQASMVIQKLQGETKT